MVKGRITHTSPLNSKLTRMQVVTGILLHDGNPTQWIPPVSCSTLDRQPHHGLLIIPDHAQRKNVLTNRHVCWQSEAVAHFYDFPKRQILEVLKNSSVNRSMEPGNQRFTVTLPIITLEYPLSLLSRYASR